MICLPLIVTWLLTQHLNTSLITMGWFVKILYPMCNFPCNALLLIFLFKAYFWKPIKSTVMLQKQAKQKKHTVAWVVCGCVNPKCFFTYFDGCNANVANVKFYHKM